MEVFVAGRRCVDKTTFHSCYQDLKRRLQEELDRLGISRDTIQFDYLQSVRTRPIEIGIRLSGELIPVEKARAFSTAMTRAVELLEEFSYNGWYVPNYRTWPHSLGPYPFDDANEQRVFPEPDDPFLFPDEEEQSA